MMIIFHLAQAIGAAYVVLVSVKALTRMDHDTPHLIYLAYVALVAGSALAFFSSLSNWGQFDPDCILVAGVALFLEVNRRPPQISPRASA